ncbi:hypothetical protein FGG08_004966 [Glutinoglossum americanum]|uniref:Uncharacterized protein n=1 Tax=Glutinoglossum americanum TaxID=1670608 RepID=A0A9P8I6D0_9PEZI|nr:hypothetical protein FGG08_004966 [Glutinoglossum americanum]
MVKKTPFRDRMRRVFSRSSSSANSASENADYRKPGEKVSSRFSQPHQDMLAKWSFAKDGPRRRVSAQSMESPMGSRVHSRMHSRNPSEDSNMLKEERTIEEMEDQEWNNTNRSSPAMSEATLRGQDQNLPKTANGAVPPASGTGGKIENELFRLHAPGAVRA